MGTRRTAISLALALAAHLSAGVCTGPSTAVQEDHDGFYAFYGRVESGEDFETAARVGEHADLVVRLERIGGELVFWRGESYLPYWETVEGRFHLDELVPRSGDGVARMPDRVNTYSRVFLTEASPTRIEVLWRYLPRFEGTNPHVGFDATDFVEETWSIAPDGAVTRTVRQGTERYDEWIDPLNRRVQELRLTPRGIVAGEVSEPRRSPPPAAVAGSPRKTDAVGEAAACWSFDEGVGDRTREAVSQRECPIAGPRSYWKRGVSGTALQFDGYHTALALPVELAPAISTGITLEAWIAIGAYPWNWTPIVEQGDDDGYFLGVDGHAHAGIKLNVGGVWEELVAEEQLERNRWYHLAGTFDVAGGVMRLYLDGRPCAEREVAKESIRTVGGPVRVGSGKARRPVDPVRANTFAATYSFDGLIDELRIHDRALTPDEIADSHRALAPTPVLRETPDMGPRVLPAGEATGEFGARYATLPFYESWDGMWRFGDHADVVVEFDTQPTKFVFWRGTGYIPMLVNEKGQWYSNEFNETWGTSGGRGCQEPMSDKESFTNHARILESSPARVVVQWRYPLVDVFHVVANHDEETGWGDWSDWYYYVYPDGVAVKRMRLWTHGRRNHEWHEAMAIFGPGQHPEDIIEQDDTLTLVDLDGRCASYDWRGGPPRIRSDEYRGRFVHVVNYKAEFDPFTIAEFTGGDVYGGELTPYAVFPTWNHWPVAQMPSDGRYASFPDRTAHSSLTHAAPAVYREDFGDAPFEERLMMEGMSCASPSELATLARSWLRAAECSVTSGGRSLGYDRAQRAYVLVAEASELRLTIEAGEERPVDNLCLVVENWGGGSDAKLFLEGEELACGPAFRQGIVRNHRGERRMVIWIERQSRQPLHFELRGAAPGVVAGPSPDPAVWEAEPAVVDDALAIVMRAGDATSGSGVEYFFECLGHPEFDSGWTRRPDYRASGLVPNTGYAFRVKVRELALFTESGWSDAVAATVGSAPGPRAHWRLDEVTGAAAADAVGAHPGTIDGPADWIAGREGGALELDGRTTISIDAAGALSSRADFTWTAWIRTVEGGAILARAGAGRRWSKGGKVLFVADGRLTLDVGWVGAARADVPVGDGVWRFVAVVVDVGRGGDRVTFYVDGELAGSSAHLSVGTPEAGLPLKIGHCNEDFPRPRAGFLGALDDLRWYDYALSASSIATLHASYGDAR